MAAQKPFPPTWKSVKKGDAIPYQAVKAGYTDTDGVLYIGKAENGEIGKYNTSNKTLKNLWASNSGKHDHGYIFVCDPDRVIWREYRYGGELPADAFLAGSYPMDGDLYIGRCGGDRGGEVGKINLKPDGVTMQNMWVHSTYFKYTTGEILCVREQLVSIVFGDLDLISETPKVVHKATLKNDGDTKLVQKFKWTEQQTTTGSLTINVGFEYSVKESLEGNSGILPGGKVSAEVGFTLSFGVSGTITHEDQTGKEHETDVTIEPGNTVEFTATLIEKRGRLPFTLRFESGKEKTGYWEGVTQSAASVITKNLWALTVALQLNVKDNENNL